VASSWILFFSYVSALRSSGALVSLLGNNTGNREGYNTKTCSSQKTNQWWSAI